MVGRQGVLVLEDGEEAPGNGIVGGDGLDMLQIVPVHLHAGWVGLPAHLLHCVCQKLCDVGPVGVAFELDLHRGDPQQLGKGQDDVPLFAGGTQQEVDGLHLHNLDVPLVLGDDHPLPDVLHREKLLGHVMYPAAFLLGRLGTGGLFHFALWFLVAYGVLVRF